MSEEINDASITLPRALMWSTVPNFILAFLMVRQYATCPDWVEEADGLAGCHTNLHPRRHRQHSEHANLRTFHPSLLQRHTELRRNECHGHHRAIAPHLMLHQ